MGMLYSADHGNVVSGDEWTPLLRESEKRALGGEDLKAKRSGKKERKVVCIMAGFLGLVVVGLLSWRGRPHSAHWPIGPLAHWLIGSDKSASITIKTEYCVC
jgi:hypothetical protein